MKCPCGGHAGACSCDHTLAKNEIFGEPVIMEFPAMIKASVSNGRKMVNLEASATVTDAEGDVIMQKALLDSQDYFLENGHLDIDHYSELAKNPDFRFLGLGKAEQWIVGKPLEVYDLGNYRTGVKAEIKSSPDGTFDPDKNKYDWLWGELQKGSDIWKASVYGFPGRDTTTGGCVEGTNGWVCATRYLVKSFRWCSLALTKNPINQGLEHPVRIISAKSFAAMIGNSMPTPKGEPTFNRHAIRKSYYNHISDNCVETNNGKNITVHTIRGHFIKCEHLPYPMADLFALATKELINRDTR